MIFPFHNSFEFLAFHEFLTITDNELDYVTVADINEFKKSIDALKTMSSKKFNDFLIKEGAVKSRITKGSQKGTRIWIKISSINNPKQLT